MTIGTGIAIASIWLVYLLLLIVILKYLESDFKDVMLLLVLVLGGVTATMLTFTLIKPDFVIPAIFDALKSP